MKRRKVLIGMGALAAGSAAAVGTGAFTSVSANRHMNVQTEDDAEALLALEPEDSPNGDAYVDDSGTTISLDIETMHSAGVNDDAYTVVRNLFRVTNNGTQKVYAWAEGVPEGVRMFHDDDGGANYKMTGAGNNQGAFSDTSNLNPSDPADTSDPKNPGGYEAAPLLTPGDTLKRVGMLIDTRDPDPAVDYFDDVTIKAVAESEL